MYAKKVNIEHIICAFDRFDISEPEKELSNQDVINIGRVLHMFPTLGISQFNRSMWFNNVNRKGHYPMFISASIVALNELVDQQGKAIEFANPKFALVMGGAIHLHNEVVKLRAQS